MLKYNPNVNLLNEPNTRRITTMLIAAVNENVSMMKLLIQHGFDCDKYINNIFYSGDHRTVFLQLCYNGNVECMDYLMNQCKNQIDIWQRDIYGENGLYLAVNMQHVSMVKYLLDNVYKNDEMKRRIFNQTIGVNHMHISSLAAHKGTTQEGLHIFKLLKENRCPIHPHAIRKSASHSSLFLDYVLNEQLYPNYIYLTTKLIHRVLSTTNVTVVHKNILIIVQYLCNMKDDVSINEYQKWITNILYGVTMRGTMDGYFKMFQEMIEILLHNKDWKCFTTSKIIDKTLLVNLRKKINDPANTRDICDDKWCLLLQTMIDSFDNKTLVNAYDNCDDSDDESDLKTNDGSNEDESDATKLIELLKNDQFAHFNQILDQYKITKQEHIVKTVERRHFGNCVCM